MFQQPERKSSSELNQSQSLLTLMMSSPQVFKTSVTTTDNSPSQDYTHLNDHTTLSELVFYNSSNVVLLARHEFL